MSRFTPVKSEDDVMQIQRILLGQTKVTTVFDVGAWIGKTAASYSEVFSESVVHAFEPFPESFAKLKANTGKLDRSILVNELAVCAEVGEKILHSNKIETTNSLLESKSTNSEHDFFRDTINRISVKTTNLDEYCKTNGVNHINILKVDTQGGELEVFRGASKLLEQGKIDLIYCEVSFIAMYEDTPLFHDIVQFFEAYDYTFHNIYGAVSNEYGQLAWSDAIFYSNRINQQLKN